MAQTTVSLSMLHYNDVSRVDVLVSLLVAFQGSVVDDLPFVVILRHVCLEPFKNFVWVRLSLRRLGSVIRGQLLPDFLIENNVL